MDKFKSYVCQLKAKVKSTYINSPLSLVFDLIEAKTGGESEIIALGKF